MSMIQVLIISEGPPEDKVLSNMFIDLDPAATDILVEKIEEKIRQNIQEIIESFKEDEVL